MIDTKTGPDRKHLLKNMTKDQAKDTGMAMVLILFILGYFIPDRASVFHIAAVIVLIINMIAPSIYKPLAYLWFGLALVLGTVMSKVLLAVIFIFLVTPVGLVRRMLGKDTLFFDKMEKRRLVRIPGKGPRVSTGGC